MEKLRPSSKSKLSKVIMFHIGRSGSTVTGDLLNQNRYIYWDGELFEISNHKSFKYFSMLLPNRSIDFIRVHALKTHLLKKTARYYGFETKFFHLESQSLTLPQFFADLKRLGLSHVIILKRNNYLRKVMSSLVGQQLRQYHLKVNEKSSLKKIAIDVNAVAVDGITLPLLSHFQQWDENFVALEELLNNQRVLKLTYEDDVFSDPRVAYRKICHFLDIEPEAVKISYSKTNPFLVKDMLINFDQVTNALESTKYEWMLYQ